MKESSLKISIELLVFLLLGFDVHLGVELVHRMSVSGESLGAGGKSKQIA